MVALSTRFAALALTLVIVDALPLPMNSEDAASGPSLSNAFHHHGDHYDTVVIVDGDHKHVEAKRNVVNIGGGSVELLGDGLDVCIGGRCTRDEPQSSYLRSRIVGRNALNNERQLETPLAHEGAPSERHINSRVVGRRAVDDVKPRADPGSGHREDYGRRDQSKRYLGLNGLDVHVDALPVAEAEVVLPRSWSRVMRPILGARSNAAAQSSRRSDDSPSGVSGTIALMTPNGSGANMTQVASLALGDPTAEKLVFDASAVNSTEVTLKTVPSDSLMAANIDIDSLSSSRIPVTLSVSAFDSSKAMMKELCTTFDPAPSAPVKFELEDCFDGSNPAHKSQLFTYNSNTGELQPLWQNQSASDGSDDTDDDDEEDDEKDGTDTQAQGGAVDPPTPKGGNLAVITDFVEDDYPVDASHPPMMAAAVMSNNGSTSSSSVGPKPTMASVAGTNGTAYSSSTNSSSASVASTNSTMHSSATNSSSASDPAPNTVNGQSVVLIFKPVAGISVSKSSPVAAAAASPTSQTNQTGSGAAMPTVSMAGAARLSTSTVSTASSSTAASASDNASGYDLEMVPVSNSATPVATMKTRRDSQDPVLPLPPAAATAASSTMRKRMHARDLVASSDVMPLAASTSSSSTSTVMSEAISTPSSASAPSPTMNRRHARDLMSSSVVSSSTAMASAAATSGFMDAEDAEWSSRWTRTAAASSTASPAMFTRAVEAPDSSSSVEEYAAPQMLTVNLPPPSPTSAPATSAPATSAPSTSASSEPTISSSMIVESSATPEPTTSSSTVADTVTMTSSEPAVTMTPTAGRRRSFRFMRNVDV